MREYNRFSSYLKPHWVILSYTLICMLITTLLGAFSLSIIVPVANNILGGKETMVSASMPDFLQGFLHKLNSLPRITLLNYIAVTIIIVFFIKQIFLFWQTYMIQDL